jgi:hypothetical protein
VTLTLFRFWQGKRKVAGSRRPVQQKFVGGSDGAGKRVDGIELEGKREIRDQYKLGAAFGKPKTPATTGTFLSTPRYSEVVTNSALSIPERFLELFQQDQKLLGAVQQNLELFGAWFS